MLIEGLGNVSFINGILRIQTLKVNSSTNRVGIGRIDPERALDVFDGSNPQLRLTKQIADGFVTPAIFSDLHTDSSGFLNLSGSGGKVKIDNSMQITGLSSGTGVSTKYLALDSSNNVILTSSAPAGIETRNRRKITGNTTLSSNDYYIGVSASANVSINLLKASTLPDGQTFTIKDERGNANSIELKIQASGSDLIDGENFVIIESPHGAINLYTDGASQYFIF